MQESCYRFSRKAEGSKIKVSKMIEIKDTSIHIIRSFTYVFKYVEGIRRIKTSNIFPNGRKRRNSFNLEKVCCDANRSILHIGWWIYRILYFIMWLQVLNNMTSMTFKIKKLDIQNRFRSGIWKCYSKPSETNNWEEEIFASFKIFPGTISKGENTEMRNTFSLTT